MKSYPIELGGNMRNLRYGFNAFVAFEEATGDSIMNIGGTVTIKMLRALIWAGLRWEDKSLTVDAVGDMVDEYMEEGGDLETLMKSVTTAIEQSGLVKKGKTKDEPGE